MYIEELPFQGRYKITVEFVYNEPEFSPVFIADTDPVEPAVVKYKKRHYTLSLVLGTEWLVKEDLLWMKNAMFRRIKGDVYDKTNSIGIADNVARFVVDRLFPKNGLAAGIMPAQPPAPEFAEMSHSLPGVREKVNAPCDCHDLSGIQHTIRNIIMHLNDSHHWTRNAIADWLESLDVDLEFKAVDTPPDLE